MNDDGPAYYNNFNTTDGLQLMNGATHFIAEAKANILNILNIEGQLALQRSSQKRLFGNKWWWYYATACQIT